MRSKSFEIISGFCIAKLIIHKISSNATRTSYTTECDCHSRTDSCLFSLAQRGGASGRKTTTVSCLRRRINVLSCPFCVE